ncbi:MAG: hypothetical protein ACWGQW_09055 [bacterium]
MPILGKKGVTPEMEFKCCECGDTVTGSQVISNAVYLHIVSVNAVNPMKSVFRCELCQEEKEEGLL